MSWDNYGNKNNNWNFDHKICCELFDLSDPNQQRFVSIILIFNRYGV